MIDQRLETFLSIVKTGSYTKSAHALFISQPAVTQQIKALEKELGVKLFTYQHRKLSLTPAGKELKYFGTHIMTQTHKFKQELMHPTPIENLTFAATLSISESLVPAVVTDFYHHHPDANIHFKTLNTAGCLAELQAGRIDFALIEGNFDKTRFTTKMIQHDPFIAVTAPKSGIFESQEYQLSDLTRFPIVYREKGSGSYEIFKHILDTQNLTPNDFKAQIQVSNPTSVKFILESGVGIGWLYQSVVQEQLEAGTLIKIPIESIQITHPIYLVYLDNPYFQQKYAKWLDHMFPNSNIEVAQ